MADWGKFTAACRSAAARYSRVALPYVGPVLRHACSGAALFALVLLVNPFGIATWGDLRSHNIWQTLYASHYDTHGADDLTNPRNLVTVVKLDEEDEVAAGPPGEFADSLHYLQIFRTLHQGARDPDGKVALRHARPKAIFIDLLMGDWAPGDGSTVDDLLDLRVSEDCPLGIAPDGRYSWKEGAEGKRSPFRCLVRGIAEMTRYKDWAENPTCTASELAKMRCIVRAGGMPVLIASPLDPRVRRPSISSAGAEALATVAVAVPIFVNARGYWLVHPQRLEERDNTTTWQLTPAAMLYALYCADKGRCPAALNPIMEPNPEEAQAQQAAWLNEPRWSTKFETPIDVIWGVGDKDRFGNSVDALTRAGTQQTRCTVADRSFGATVVAFFRAFFAGVDRVPDAPVSAKKLCLYQHEIGFTDLRTGSVAKAGSATHQTVLANALAGKIVMIGRAVRNSGDFVEAGPHEQVPGVYYHAMALDNLIRRGDDYPTLAIPLFSGLTFSNHDLANTGAAFVMLLFGGVVAVQYGREGRASIRSTLWREALVAVAWLLGAALWMYATLFLFTRAPALVPDRFNIAALSIVLVIEFFSIAWLVLRPLAERIAAKSETLRQLFKIKPVRHRDAAPSRGE